MDIQKITSFEVNHDKLMPGIYVSRIDGDITTYDLRTLQSLHFNRSSAHRTSICLLNSQKMINFVHKIK